MNNDFYKQLIQESPIGYAYRKIIYDENDIPCDFEFIEVNNAFEKLTGLSGIDIVGRRFTEILPLIRLYENNPINFYGKIASNGGKSEFDYFSETLNKWYKVNVYSPEKKYFITHFIDITKEIDQFSEMQRLVQISEEFLQIDDKKICYKKISDDFLKICGAKYAAFNLFDENGENFTTMAISMEKGIVKTTQDIMGFKLENRKWKHDKVRDEIIQGGTIIRFNSLEELTGDSLPITLMDFLEDNCNAGQTVLIKIIRNNIMLGNFTLIMEKGKSFDKDALAEVYTRQLGTVITRKKAEEDLKESDERFQLLFKNHNAAMLLIEPESGQILDSNFAAAKFYDYSINQLNSMSIDDINIMPADKIKEERAKAAREERNHFIFNHKLKGGEIRTVEVHSSHINYKGVTILFSIIHDITQRKLAEKLAYRRNLSQKLIADISTDLINASVDNFHDKINNMLKASGEFFEVDISAVIEISHDGSNFTNVHEWCAAGIEPKMTCANGLPLNSLPWLSRKLKNCEIINISDIDKLPEIDLKEKEMFKRTQLQSLLNIQLTNKNGIIGSLVYASIKAQKVWGEDQIELLKVLANTVSDALSKNRMEKEILAAKEKAEKENSLKTEFFANMSHEFRTPLNVMLSTIQLFELYAKNQECLTEQKTAKHLKAMKQNSLRLLRLVNNLIDISKIESGFYEPAFNNSNIVDVIEKIVLSIKGYAKQKNISVKFKSDLKENIIKCDVDMIERIMLNLISNAIKFSSENCLIKISIINKVDVVIITVKDNGVGIEKDKQDIIFEKYRQASTNLSRTREGSGIGLSLTKCLVEMHGGRIYVKSEFGKGSEFIIEIPNTKYIEEKIILNGFDDSENDHRFISKMNVEFSDIYF